MQIGSRFYAIEKRPGYIEIWRIGPLPLRSEPLADDGVLGWNHYAGCAGFHVLWYTDSVPGPATSQWGMLEISFWWIMIATFFLPFAMFVRMFPIKRKLPQNYCDSCGYDLRATPDRCPECGRIRPKK